MSKTTTDKKKLALHWKIIIGMLLGVIWALISSSIGWSEFTIKWIDPFGIIFINLLKLIAVPLVLLSIISGISNLGNTVSLGKIGGKTLLLYIFTSLVYYLLFYLSCFLCLCYYFLLLVYFKI